MIDSKKEIQENLIHQILHEIGENPSRKGLIGTPERVVKMWKEIFGGYDLKNKPKVTIFPNGQDGITYNEMIMDMGDFYSHCEHHMVPFFGKYYFGYIPSEKGNIIGLSKVARLVDFHSARLQVQERLVNDITNDIWKYLDCEHPPKGMGLIMEGEHLCKSMRGVRKKGKMTTISLIGNFRKSRVKNEFLKILK